MNAELHAQIKAVAIGESVFFVNGKGKVFSGRVIWHHEDYIQVRVPPAAEIPRGWYSLCFHSKGDRIGEAMALPSWSLKFPEGFEELATCLAEATNNNGHPREENAPRN